MWALWHFPSILWSDYNNGTPAWYAISCFTVMIVATGVIAAWLTFKSQSLWPAVFLHGAHNTLIQLVLTPWTTDTGRTAYFIDEFGIGLAIGASVVAIVLWRLNPVLPDMALQPTSSSSLRSSAAAAELGR
jgi:membrane protease YdiL (CAAX protease family)